MKLMKKNSSNLAGSMKKIQPALKIDWSKITDRNSSVHSEELSPAENHEEGGLDEMLQVKRKIKEVEG